jgi:hypothetical protein
MGADKEREEDEKNLQYQDAGMAIYGDEGNSFRIVEDGATVKISGLC